MMRHYSNLKPPSTCQWLGKVHSLSTQISLTHGIYKYHTECSFVAHAGIVAKETLGASQVYFSRLKVVDRGGSSTIGMLIFSHVFQELNKKKTYNLALGSWKIS